MAITKEEVIAGLHEAHQEMAAASRKVMMLMLRFQNADESVLASEAARTVNGGIAAAAAAKPPQLEQVFIPQFNTQQVVAEAVAAGLKSPEVQEVVQEALAAAKLASPLHTERVISASDQLLPLVGLKNAAPENADAALTNPRVHEALARAKGVLKDLMTGSGLPDNLLALVDKVKPEDLYKLHAATQQPTEVASQPTEHVEVEEKPTLSALIGRGSIFVEHLSKNVIFNGRGEIEPKYTPEIKRYAQDALWTEESILRNYPTGFYLNRDTKVMQLMVNTDQFAIVVDGLPNENAPVHVLTYGGKLGFRAIQDFMPSEQRLIHAKLDLAFAELKKKQ